MFALFTLGVLLLSALVSIITAIPTTTHVVGGQDTDIEKYPFMISLRYSAGGSHTCGGTIIAPRWLLTAAHCVSGISASLINVQYGVTKIENHGPNIAKVKRIIWHSGYDPYNAYANDIALLELTEQLKFNEKNVDAVKLPAQNFEIPQLAEGVPGVLIGVQIIFGSIQKHLQVVNLKIYSDNECTARHDGATSKDHICGGVDEGGKGQCSGDSGGPLLYQGNIQLGIVSWSVKPCTVAPYPGVYTKVSHYINWIRSYVNL